MARFWERFVSIVLSFLLLESIASGSALLARAAQESTTTMCTMTSAKASSGYPIDGSAVALEAGLRSAFLLRGAHEYPDPVTDPVEQLRQHFTVVLHLLVRGTEESLQLALERLESYRGSAFDRAEKATALRYLRHQRMINVLRLQAYRLRGVFPQNEYSRPRPIFVDGRDNACAVGYLMREAGWDDAVTQVHRLNNFVFVPDIDSGPVLEWILQSGLTQEEAALIQPSYGPPPPGYVKLDYYPQDGGLVLDTGNVTLTTIEIKSTSGLFIPERQPPQIQFPFDVYTPYKLFLLRPEGMGSQSFGDVLPAGLTGDRLLADISVQGSLVPSGALENWCFSFSPPCVPEPSGVALMATGMVVAMTRMRHRQPRLPTWSQSSRN